MEIAQTDWRKLFAASADQTLRYFPPQKTKGKLHVPAEVFEEGEQK